MSAADALRVRLDRWLWAARFFKTRALASAAVSGGKVHLAGQRVKPARAVRLGDNYEVQRGFERLEIIVTGLASRRGSASDAQQLYRETEASAERRQQEREQRRLAALSRPRGEGRPSKRQRRQIHRFRDRNQS
ncbi:MAG: S4 domain-containing protein [Gammaproteobacteria bacterium]|nr:S4 domain-containing protein [Gammaproteobacteria bacterium]